MSFMEISLLKNVSTLKSASLFSLTTFSKHIHQLTCNLIHFTLLVLKLTLLLIPTQKLFKDKQSASLSFTNISQISRQILSIAHHFLPLEWLFYQLTHILILVQISQTNISSSKLWMFLLKNHSIFFLSYFFPSPI